MVHFQHEIIHLRFNKEFDGENYIKNKYSSNKCVVYKSTHLKKILKSHKLDFLQSKIGLIFISNELYKIFNASTSGIPDLITLQLNGTFKFIEVKNDGDSINGNQMMFYSNHETLHITVYYLKIKYIE